MARIAGAMGTGAFWLVLSLGLIWAALAVWVQLEGGLRIVALAALGCVALGGFYAWRRRPLAGWGIIGLAALGIGAWYATISPSAARDWAFDVARGVKADLEGETVTLSDLRDFDWRAVGEADERWITRSYDLAALESVDMFTSVWDNPDIAHLLVSFGFSDGEHVVFSVEIRREKGEAFSELGGFFRQFELILIGATERDIVKLRTNYRREDVRLYPVTLTAARRRAMFLSYVDLAQRLEAEPRFYNTVMANCTTTVYRLARVLRSDLPVDQRLILSGRLPDYLHDLGVLGGNGALADRRAAAMITPKALAADDAVPFSEAIRR